jgi:hypothetical protein
MDSSKASWTITLFPTLPLAMLAVVQMTHSPSFVLIDDGSTLDTHVSATVVAQQGYVLQTFTRHESRLNSREKLYPMPQLQLAVHQNLDALNTRLASEQSALEIGLIWNHVESLAATELPWVMLNSPTAMFSATIALSGYPGGIGLLLEADRLDLAGRSAAQLGLV